jgi:hypothetical protein
MEAIRASEVLLNFHQSARCRIPADSILFLVTSVGVLDPVHTLPYNYFDVVQCFSFLFKLGLKV